MTVGKEEVIMLGRIDTGALNVEFGGSKFVGHYWFRGGGCVEVR
jgi:hypothetical protein